MRRRVAGAITVTMVLGACGLGIAAGADFSPTVDFSRYTSFVWDEPDDRPIGDPRLENNPFFEDRLHAAVAVELARFGVAQGAIGPRLIVHHHVTVRPRTEVYEADVRAGYGGGYPEASRVVTYEEGTLLVDIADASTRDVIWRGWAQFDITRALANPDVMSRAIEESMRRMFEDFPGLER